MQRFLAFFVAAQLVIGVAAITFDLPRRIDRVVTTDDDGVGLADGGDPVLRPDQARITGTATAVIGDDVDGGPIPTPFTLTIKTPKSRRAAVIDPVVVSKKSSTVVWDGGRPLPLTAVGATAGAIDIGPAHVEIRGTTISWFTDGAPRLLLPATYRAGATVAVGTAGLGRPVDGARFEATDATTIETFDGVAVTLPLGPTKLTGPGKLRLEGDLRVDTSTGSRAARSVAFGPGAFELDLAPVDGGLQITALLQGPIQLT